MNALEELTEPHEVIDRHYVERRVLDWRQRVDKLYADLRGWLPDGWTASDAHGVSMREDLMWRFDVPATEMPALALSRGDALIGRVEPRGLWIIGTNGRVDLTLPDKHYLFVDRSESFETADWRVAPIEARREQKLLSRNLIRNILA